MSTPLSLGRFTPLVGTGFRLRPSAEHVVACTLIEARALAPAGYGVDPFSLIFRTAPGAPLPQRTYRVEHDEIGVHDIFLVPIGPDRDGMRYEAIFA